MLACASLLATGFTGQGFSCTPPGNSSCTAVAVRTGAFDDDAAVEPAFDVAKILRHG